MTKYVPPVALTAQDVIAGVPTVAKPEAANLLWYLAGGISAANCIGAYQAKGAADLAASYVNLANPGTYDLTAGNAPAFDAADGWTFTILNATYLITGITPDVNTSFAWSVAVRFSNASGSTNNWLFGSANTSGGTSRLELIVRPATPRTSFIHGQTQIDVAEANTSGVDVIAGNKGYIDTVEKATFSTLGNGTALAMFIGARNNNGSAAGYFTGKIQAIAFYDTVLTTTQIGLLTTAMNAL